MFKTFFKKGVRNKPRNDQQVGYFVLCFWFLFLCENNSRKQIQPSSQLGSQCKLQPPGLVLSMNYLQSFRASRAGQVNWAKLVLWHFSPTAPSMVLIHFLLWLPPLQLPLRPVSLPWMCTLSAEQGWMIEILGPRSPWPCPTDPNPNTSRTPHPCRQHYPFPLDPTGLMPRIKTRLVGGCLGSGDSWCGKKSQDLYSQEWVWIMSWAASLISPMSLLFSWAKYNIFTALSWYEYTL